MQMVGGRQVSRKGRTEPKCEKLNLPKTDGKRRRWSWERLIWRRHAVWRASGESIWRGRRRKVKMMLLSLHLVIRSRDWARSGSKIFSKHAKVPRIEML